MYSDIDGTLLIEVANDPFKGKKCKLNDNLIQAWKEAGIKEITLITNSGKSDINTIYNYADQLKNRFPLCLDEYDPTHSGYSHIPRPIIVKYLEDQGFIVKAVVTGADREHNQGPGEAFKLLADDYQNAITYAKNRQNQVLTEKFPLSKQTQAFETKNKNINVYYPDIVTNTKQIKGYEDSWDRAVRKRMMFEYTINELPPSKSTKVVYYEDEIEAVNHVKEQYQNQADLKFQLSICPIQDPLKKSKKYYLETLSENKFVITREIDECKIDEFRQKLLKLINNKSRFNPFLVSNEEKQAVLRSLLTMVEIAIIEGKDKSIADVITAWEEQEEFQSKKKWNYEWNNAKDKYFPQTKYKNKQLIGHHRNIFFSNERGDVLTGTQKAIQDLIKDYGTLKLGVQPRENYAFNSF